MDATVALVAPSRSTGQRENGDGLSARPLLLEGDDIGQFRYGCLPLVIGEVILDHFVWMWVRVFCRPLLKASWWR
jgi:hypothetical protein